MLMARQRGGSRDYRRTAAMKCAASDAHRFGWCCRALECTTQMLNGSTEAHCKVSAIVYTARDGASLLTSRHCAKARNAPVAEQAHRRMAATEDAARNDALLGLDTNDRRRVGSS
jgi:hypothetical protein